MEEWRVRLDRIEALMEENAKEMAENAKGFAELRELQKENAKSFAKLEKKISEMADEVKRLNRTVCGVEKSNGMMTEEYFFNSLNATKTFGGVSFDKIERNKYDVDFDNGEYDIIMINGNCVGIIEAKYRVRPNDVSKLVKQQVRRFKNLFPQYSDYKYYLGIGGMSFTNGVEKRAKELGIGILKLKGDAVEIHDENLKVY